MSLSEVTEIKESPLQMDVPAVQEEKKDTTLVVFTDNDKVPSLEDISGKHIISTVLEGIVEVPNVKDATEKMSDELLMMQVLFLYSLSHGISDTPSEGLPIGEVVPQDVDTAPSEKQEEVPEECQLPPYKGWSESEDKQRRSMLR